MTIDYLSTVMAQSRVALWERLCSDLSVRVFLEIGVWRGQFAQHILSSCEQIETYYMLDSWRRLPGWNKPWNVSPQQFEAVYGEAISRSDFARKRRRVLRGTTKEKIGQIANGEVDAAYIDGDHTLRGIVIDLINVFPKVRLGGIVGGDDFTPTIWPHPPPYEPTLVFPFVTLPPEAYLV